MADNLMPDGRSVLIHAVSNALRPRQRLTVSQWSDNKRILSSKSSSEPGRWRTSRTPYLKEPMDCLSAHSDVREVNVVKAAQLGFTTALGVNWVGYTIDHDPASMLIAVPTDKLMEEWVEQDLDPMLTDTPCVAEKMSIKSRDAANRKDLKGFPSGLLMLMGANSANNFRQKKAKKQYRDDIDGWPHAVGQDGDPVDLLDNRSKTFPRRKIVNVSTPTVKGASRIDDKYEQSDQRRYYVPCPHCHEEQVLRWKNLQYSLIDGVVKDAWYVCQHCGCEIEEHYKPAMLKAGRWIAENPNAPKGVRGYQISGLYSPIGLGNAWLVMAQNWVNAQGNPLKLKVFFNTELGKSYEDNRHSLKPSVLMERREDYALKTIPPGVLALTVGLDTQNDRLPLQLLGHGRGGRVWVLDYVELPGDPNNVIPDFVDKKGVLFDYLNQTFLNAWGKAMRIQAVGWDTGGHRTDAIYTACRSKVVSRLLAMKSWSIGGKPVLAPRPSHQDVKWNGKTNKRGVALWMVGSDTAKDLIIAHLVGDEEKSSDDRMIHFSAGLDEDYFKMLLAEKFDPEKNRYVKKSGVRNESIDTFVYGLAAARHPSLRLHTKTKADWDALEKMLQPTDLVQGDDGVYRVPEVEAAAATDEFKASASKKPRRTRRRNRKSWATKW